MMLIFSVSFLKLSSTPTILLSCQTHPVQLNCLLSTGGTHRGTVAFRKNVVSYLLSSNELHGKSMMQ